MFPAIFFFPLALWKHCAFLLLVFQLVPALPLVHTKSSLRHGEGMPRLSCSKLVCIRKKKNTLFCKLKVCFPWRVLTLFSYSFLGGFFSFVMGFWGFFKLSLLGASLELSMKAMICFLVEFPKEMKLLPLAWLSVSLLCL